MKSSKVSQSIFIILLALLTYSCVSYTPIQQASGSGLSLHVSEDKYTILGVGRGSACESRILGFFIGANEFAYEAATLKAIATRQGNHLIQVTSDVRTHNAFFYYEVCVVVRGIVVKLKALNEAQAPVLEHESLDQVQKNAYRIEYQNLIANFSKIKSNQYVSEVMVKSELETGPFKLKDKKLAVFEAHTKGKPHEIIFLIVNEKKYHEVNRAMNVGYSLEILFRLEKLLNNKPVVTYQRII